jgi:hypothetical protein
MREVRRVGLSRSLEWAPIRSFWRWVRHPSHSWLSHQTADRTVALVRVFSPDSEPDLVAVVAMLEAHEIPCFVHGAAFGSLYPGPQIQDYNTRAVMVSEENEAAALELIRDFQSQPDEPDSGPQRPSGRLRSFIEFLLFGWFVPGSRPSGRREPRKP